MAKIAVICANAPKPNPGMLSVDLAFYALSKRYGFYAGVQFYRVIQSFDLHKKRPLELQEEIKERERSPIEYARLSDEPGVIENADFVIYWGDFSHMERFESIIAKRYANTFDKTHAEGVDCFYDYFFMENLPEINIKKAIVFGGTLLFNGNRAFSNKRYVNNFRRFFSSLALTKVRDPISANQLAQHLGNFLTNYQGVDCSQLLKKEDVINCCPKNNAETDFSGIGVFFGRSSDGHQNFLKLLKILSQSFHPDVKWIPWWYSKESRGDLKKIKRLGGLIDFSGFENHPSLGDLLGLVGNCRLIVTDTYHLCVNAWKLGVPAVCIVNSYESEAESVNSGGASLQRDKRVLFYDLNQLSEFLVYDVEIKSRQYLARRLGRILELLRDEGWVAEAVERMDRQALFCEQELMKVIGANGSSELSS